MRERIRFRRTAWRERWDRARRPVAIALAIGYGLVLFFAFAWSQCFFDGCPDVESLAAYQPGGAPVLFDRNGEAFADLAPLESEREVVPLFSLPSHVAQAFLAVEDKRFYGHGGIDWRRVGGAALANLRSGGFAQGFSTLTMQLARNVFPERIPGQEQSARRKLLEIRVAKEIEARYSKEEILELYLNHIYFGNRARGIQAAARQYFGVPAERLTLPQAALLAALIKAPSHYDPRQHPNKALERRNLVLALMEEQGRIPRIQSQQATRSPLGIVPAPRQARVESGLAPWFVEQVRRELEERFGPELYTRPLRVVTTLDSGAQRAAEEELRRQLKAVESGQMGSFDAPRYTAASTPPADGTRYLQGALVMIDPANGDVLAWVGGRDYAQSQFDRVVQARRQPGSAFKPFVYAAALEKGWVLSQPLLDQPLKVRLADGRIWEPKNFTGRYEGRVTMRDALVRSKNVATVRLAQATGLGEVATLARESGIDEPVAELELPSMALGAMAVSPLELTSAYTAFAGLGQAAEPRLVQRVEDEDGQVLWEAQVRRHQAVQPAVAYLITDVLSEALERGTGFRVRQSGLEVPAAGKTGTTNDGTDTWFVGYTPNLVAGIWLGFDQPRPIVEDATGGQLAAPIWARVVERVYRKHPRPEPWKAPSEVVSRRVDPQTGLLLDEGCEPKKGSAYEELFVEGLEPASYCPGREAPPRNGFPASRLAAEREAREREAARQIAAREAEQKRIREEAQERELERQRQILLAQKREREQREQAEARQMEQERRAAREAEAKKEAARLAQVRERERLEEEARKKEAARLAQVREAEQRRVREENERRERKAAAEAEEKEKARLAQARERERLAEEARKKEAARLAQVREAEQRRVREENERREREAAAEAKEEAEEKEKARLAEARKAEREREAAALRERRERLAREEAEADRRVRDLEDRERELLRDDERPAREPAREEVEEPEEEAADEEEDEPAGTDLSGWWELTNTIRSTNYEAYKGLRLGYRIQLEQDGNRITGRGQKWTEDGRTIPSSGRTPITVTGRVEGGKVTLQFTERGARRSTNGGFTWTLSADRTALRGTFWSNAADASGSSLARRMP
jgi:penicillin-binding protein 1A